MSTLTTSAFLQKLRELDAARQVCITTLRANNIEIADTASFLQIAHTMTVYGFSYPWKDGTLLDSRIICAVTRPNETVYIYNAAGELIKKNTSPDSVNGWVLNATTVEEDGEYQVFVSEDANYSAVPFVTDVKLEHLYGDEAYDCTPIIKDLGPSDADAIITPIGLYKQAFGTYKLSFKLSENVENIQLCGLSPSTANYIWLTELDTAVEPITEYTTTRPTGYNALKTVLITSPAAL